MSANHSEKSSTAMDSKQLVSDDWWAVDEDHAGLGADVWHVQNIRESGDVHVVR